MAGPAPAPPGKLVFLPGAGGAASFWEPVSRRLPRPGPRALLGWPGFGPLPPRADVGGLDDLERLVLAELDRPVALVAQSMGGVLAVRAAAARPQRVTRLVLCATSGGVDVAARGGHDWRPAFFAANPTVPRWFGEPTADLTPLLVGLAVPTLLVWGDADPISPVAVGEHLRRLLPRARLHVVPGGGHDLAVTHAEAVAEAIDRFLGETHAEETAPRPPGTR